MNTEALSAAYEEWHARIPAEGGWVTPWHELIMRGAEPHLVEATVLEIGCGRGGFTVELARRGTSELTAADFSQHAVQMAQELVQSAGLAHRVSLRVEDIQRIGLPDRQFDVVVSAETIEQVPDPDRAVRVRVLKPGGRLFLTTPNYLSMIGLHRAWVRSTGREYTEGGQPWNNVTMTLRTYLWMRRAGFDIERIDGSGHYLPIPGRPGYRLPLSPSLERLFRVFAAHVLIVGQRPT